MGVLLAARAYATTPVLTWRQTWAGPSSAYGPAAMAARELVDGSIMVAGPPALRYDHDGNLLSAASFSPPYFSSITIQPPNQSQASLVAIDPFGGIFVASVSNLSSSSGDVWLMKYDGLTGTAAWSQPVIFDSPAHRQDIPQSLLIDFAGNVLLVVHSQNYGAVLMKIDGNTGSLLWGPLVANGLYASLASLDPSGNFLTVLGNGLYKFNGQNGALLWGPVAFAGSSSNEVVTALGVGPDGSVVLAGSRSGGFEIVKYGSTGSVLWGPVAYTETSSSAPYAIGVDISGSGDVVVSGRTSDGFVVLRYRGGTGARIWGPVKPGNYTTTPTVVIAGNGDVVVSAWDQGPVLDTWRIEGASGALAWGPQTFSGATSDYSPRRLTLIGSDGHILQAANTSGGLAVLARDPATGTPSWGPTSFMNTVQGRIVVADVGQDAAGNVLVTGNDYGGHYATVKCARSNGAILWGPVLYDAPGYPMMVRADPSGDVVVLGAVGVVLKYSGVDGSLLWATTPGTNLQGARLAIDASGNIFIQEQLVKGTYGNEYDFVTFKLSGVDGKILWGPVVFDAGPGTNDWPDGIAITPGGDVVVAGVSQNSTGAEWVTLKYSGATGSLVWGPVTLPQPYGVSRDSVEDLAIDASGDIVVVGMTNTGTTQPMSTIKYSGATGAVIWGPATLADDGWATGVALDTHGDVFVTGYVYNVNDSKISADFATIKYRGTDGAVVWGPRFFNGTGNGNDYAWGLALDSDGNPVVAGMTWTASLNQDIAILKYDGSTGEPLWDPVYAGGFGKDDLPLHNLVVYGKSAVIAGRIDAYLAAAYDEVFGIRTLPEEIPVGYCGSAFSAPLAAGNATGSVTWSVVSGSLPPGLSLDAATGLISGSPFAAGFFSFRVRAQDSGSTAERDFVISVYEGSAFVPILATRNPVCSGHTTTLSVPGSWAGYQWLAGGETTATVSVSPIETTGYGVLLTDASGCTSHGYGRVFVAPLAASMQAPLSVCASGTAQASAADDAGAGATYAWSIVNGTIVSGDGTNNITFKAGNSGSVQLGVTVTDATGCVTTASRSVTIVTSCTGKGFYTVPPCRVADTRDPAGPSGGPALSAGTTRSFPVTDLCGIPSSATAVAINLAVFGPSDGGDLRVYPAGGAAPLASAINFRPGIVRANNAIIPLGVSGQISVQCDMPSGSTNLFFDVYGYFQ